MPRFVILEHDHPYLHWDFMLEIGDSLTTWRLPAAPRAGTSTEALALGDHRLAYLDYEGALSGGRGAVKRWDNGLFSWIERATDSITVRLKGARLTGRAQLTKTTANHWQFCFEREMAME
jgi:hypothetical protein